MKLFPHDELKAAFLHAETGGQALLVHVLTPEGTPQARIIDHDYDRLWSTVRRLGLKAVIAERVGEPGQSVVIRGRQVYRALEETRQLELA